MADDVKDDNTDREVVSGTPADDTPPDEELSYQEKLKQELLQLQKMQGTLVGPQAPTLDPGSQPAVQNPDGSISTVRTAGFNIDGKEVNLPTVSPEGKIMSNEEAIDQYRRTGKHLGRFDSVDEANAAARALHDQEEQQISRVPKGVSTAPTNFESPTNLPQPDYTVSPEAKIRMLSTQSIPGKQFSPEVERSIAMAARMYNIDPNVLKGFVSVESSGDPRSNINNPGTQYKGLLQMGREEWARHGDGGDIYNPEQHMQAGAKLMEENRQFFAKHMGRDPTPAELYLMHQQGPGFFTNGTTTNLAGNLPSNARTADNMTHDGFQRWWTARINRAIAERGSGPTMTKVADSNLPNGYLYPGPFADVGGKELTRGGLPDTPQAQAEIAQLMQGKPLSQMTGTEKAALEAASTAKGTQQTLPKVGTSRERQQVQGQLPVSVNQTNTLPIPGIATSGEQALSDATNPSVMSTIMQEMQRRKDAEPVVPPTPKEPVPELGFLDKLKAVISTLNGIAPYNWTAQGVKTATDAAPQVTKNAMDAIGTSGVQIPQGVISGLMAQPAQVAGGGTAAALAAGGLLTGSQNAQQKALELQNEVEDWTKARQRNVGIDPANIQPAQQAGQTIGENIGPGLIRTIKNLGFQFLANKAVIPGADYMAKNYPIPNLNPIQPAEAATVFGKPPLIVNTPGGPVVANDATVQGLAYGGLFTLGIGAAPNAVSRTIRVVK